VTKGALLCFLFLNDDGRRAGEQLRAGRNDPAPDVTPGLDKARGVQRRRYEVDREQRVQWSFADSTDRLHFYAALA
jgi:hypothetical protein